MWHHKNPYMQNELWPFVETNSEFVLPVAIWCELVLAINSICKSSIP